MFKSILQLELKWLWKRKGLQSIVLISLAVGIVYQLLYFFSKVIYR